MRKRRNSVPKKRADLSHAALVLCVVGMLIIAVPLFYTLLHLQENLPLTIPQLKYYANAIEHILAGLALLVAGCYLVERVAQSMKKE